LTHWFIESCWDGKGIALFWEGLPVYLADNVVRQRKLGFSYDQLSKALFSRDRLIPLREVINGAHFYARRSDWRINVSAASFTGYVFKTFPHELFISLYSDYNPPTSENPVIDLSTLLERSLGVSSFDKLEMNWKRYLQHEVKYHQQAYSQVKEASFSDIDSGKAHCQFCYAPLSEKGETCPFCKQDNSIKLKII
jgi:hypothetical protein